MKKCPTCNRTYSDDTLSFCLEDGALLSPTYDSEATVVLGANDPTVKNTNPNYKPETPTETKFTEPRQTASSIRESPSSKTSPHLIYAGAGLIAVLFLGGAFLWLRASGNQSSATDNTNKASSSQVPSRPSASTPAPTVENPLLASGTVPVNTPFTSVGAFSGNIVITLSGTASVDHTMPPVGPEGVVGHKAPNNNWALPGSPLYCAIARINGRVVYVGQRLQLNLTEPTEISLGPNDEPGMQGQGFKDNVGSWSYSVMRSTGNATNPPNRSNVPTTRELQETLLKEAKRIEDEANRR